MHGLLSGRIYKGWFLNRVIVQNACNKGSRTCLKKADPVYGSKNGRFSSQGGEVKLQLVKPSWPLNHEGPTVGVRIRNIRRIGQEGVQQPSSLRTPMENELSGGSGE